MREHFSPLFFADLLSDLKKTEQLLFVYIFVFFYKKIMLHVLQLLAVLIIP